MSGKKKKHGKVRIHFRRNVQKTARESSSKLTRKLEIDQDAERLEDHASHQLLSGKGKLTRKRTVDMDRAGAHADLEKRADQAAPSETDWLEGTVISIHGHFSKVHDGKIVRNCVVRRVLKSILIDQRNVVTVGDHVYFTPLEDNEGVIERIGVRHGTLVRRYRNREHMVVTNVDQAVIVGSVATPELRIHLLDRYIVAALAGELNPVIVFNKTDLPYDEPLDKYKLVYENLGYPVFQTSTLTGVGIEELRQAMRGKKSVIAGVSGVGKSSLLNAVQPGVELMVKPVNSATGRGQHTTTTVRLLQLEFGGYIVDTPGIRQFAFQNFDRRDLEAYFVEFLPYISNCKFPDCTHIHEGDCAVKSAVEAGEIADWRYDSYVKIFNDHEEFLPSWKRF